MKDRRRSAIFGSAVLASLLFGCFAPMMAAMRNWAVVVSATSKLQDVPLSELTKYCRGTQKTWPDGRNFILVVRHPDSPEMRGALEKLLATTGQDAKPSAGKIAESRAAVKLVDSDEDLIRFVESTPGAVGLLDVYAINSAVKVLRIDGKLPFDPGYSLKVN
jgi:hypothetical protein